LARQDVPVCPLVGVVRPDLRRPFRGAADNHPDAVSWLDVDRGAARRDALDMADVNLEVRRRPVLKDGGAGKLADHEPRPEDAAPVRPDSAWAVNPVLHASGGFVARSAEQPAVAAPYKPDAAPSAA
jgi:hypothetical protein